MLEHVHACQEAGNQARGDELGKEKPRISVSQIGHWPRAAIYDAFRWHRDHRLHVEPTHPFRGYVQEIMEAGNVWEHQTAKALARKFGDAAHWRKDDPALRVRNSCWSGHIDFLIDPCHEYPAGAIIEHKATNPNNFKAKDRLPYLFHCLQLLTYRQLLQQKDPSIGYLPAYLYYRSWANWGELSVWEDDRYIVWEGEINGTYKSGEIEMEYTREEQMAMLEHYFIRQELPPRYETPTAVIFSCTRIRGKKVYPDCLYFGHCWPSCHRTGHCREPDRRPRARLAARIHNIYARAGRLYQEAVEEENRYREYHRDKYEVPAVPQFH